LGIGDWAQSPIPNPQSPIPNPHPSVLLMKKSHKNLLKLNTKKIYKVEMADSISSNPKMEDYSWVYEDDESLKNKFLEYPFDEWRNLIKNIDLKCPNEGNMYQALVNIILKEDLFKGKKIFIEDNNYLYFQQFIENNKAKINFPSEEYIKRMSPDFIISDLSKDEFFAFIQRSYMVRYNQIYNNLENIDKIFILGEAKENPDRIRDKSQQREYYLNFCKFINNANKHIYFFTMYIFDISFKSFWRKTLFKKKPFIYVYIPKLFNDDYINHYYLLKKNALGNIKTMIMKSL